MVKYTFPFILVIISDVNESPQCSTMIYDNFDISESNFCRGFSHKQTASFEISGTSLNFCFSFCLQTYSNHSYLWWLKLIKYQRKSNITYQEFCFVFSLSNLCICFMFFFRHFSVSVFSYRIRVSKPNSNLCMRKKDNIRSFWTAFNSPSQLCTIDRLCSVRKVVGKQSHVTWLTWYPPPALKLFTACNLEIKCKTSAKFGQ